MMRYQLFGISMIALFTLAINSAYPQSDGVNWPEAVEETAIDIRLKAAFKTIEATQLPGVLLDVEDLSENLEIAQVQWKVIHEKGTLPADFRESKSAIFYFPLPGHYRVHALLRYRNGRSAALETRLEVQSDLVRMQVREGNKWVSQLALAAHDFKNPAEMWNYLELTGARAKPGNILGVPWYVPAGAVAAGTGLVVLIDSKEDPVPDFILNPIHQVVNCTESAVVFPLSNDVGEELSILSVDGLSTEVGIWIPPDKIEIFSGLRQGFSFSYTAEDVHGQSGSAAVTIEVVLPEFSLNEHTTEVRAGESINGNLLEDDLCSGCVITEADQPVSGSLTIENQHFSYTADPEFGGSLTINYQVEDECGQTGSSRLIIEVIPNCDISFQFDSSPADCGLENGSVELINPPDGDYRYEWSNGGTTASVSDLPAEAYLVTITNEGNGCVYEEEVNVGELTTQYLLNFIPSAGNCIESADGTFELSNPGEDVLILELSAAGENLDAVVGDKNTVTSLLEIWPDHFFEAGQYEMVVYDQSAGSECGQKFPFQLEEEDLFMELTDDYFTVYQGQELEGNILENDQGTGLVVIEYDQPDFGSLTVSENGNFTFSSDEDSSGELQINYQVKDSCGQTGQAVLVIEVLPCILTVDPEQEDADCGASNGWLRVETEDPEDYQFNWSVGGDSYFIEGLAPGDYSVTVTEIATGCREIVDFSVGSIPPDAEDDEYQVISEGDTLTANVLMNDTGNNLEVDGHDEVEGGEFTLDESGNLTFIPAGEDPGELRLWYVVRDSCNQTDTAWITIRIIPPDCEFEYTLEKDSADCGVENGWVALLVETECDYEVLWHDGSSADTLYGQASGDYEALLVLSGEGRNTDTIQVEYTVYEKKPRYIIDFELQHPTCLIDGDIILFLESQGEGNYEILAFGPEGDRTFHTSEEVFRLSEYTQVTAGQYLLTVKDLSLNCDLADSTYMELIEEELPLELNDDHYELFSGETIEFNVLDNDQGIGLKVIDFESPQFGTLQLDENGAGTFSSNIPEHGTVNVNYTVEDSCGTTGTALLTIEVILPPCDFEVEFIVKDASCGFEDGEITAVVMPPGDYAYAWSNGATTATVKNIPTGAYTLTVTDNLLQCDLVFSTAVGEMESNWIQDYEVYPFGCSNEPDIVLNLYSPDNGSLEVTLTGGDIFNQKITVPSGEVNLKDHFWLSTGQYTIVVVPVGSKPRCSETIVVQLTGVANPIDIELIQAVSPSGPNQTDGSIQIKINDVHTPFDLFLNGVYTASTNQSAFTYTNLGVGTYEIYASNSQNCTSESIVVELVSTNRWQLIQHFSSSSVTTEWMSLSEIRSGLAEEIIAEDVGYTEDTEAWSRGMLPSHLLGVTMEKDLGFNRYIYLQLEHRQGGEIWGTSEGTEHHFNWGVTRAGLGMGSQFDFGRMKINTSLGGVGNSVYGELISQNSQYERPLKLTEEYGSLEMSLGMSYPLFEKTHLRMSWKYYQLLNLDDRPGLLLIELSREF